MSNSYEGIYLLKEREFVRCGDNIFKVGRSGNVPGRVKQYPKDSDLYVMILCKDSVTIEKDIINLFNDKFNRMKDYGAEYFEGNLNDLIETLRNYMKDNSCTFYELKNAKTHTFNFRNIMDNQDIIKTVYKAKINVKTNNVVNNNILNSGIKHTCIICSYTTNRSTLYRSHLLTKKHNVNVQNNMNFSHNVKNIDLTVKNIDINKDYINKEDTNKDDINKEISKKKILHTCKICSYTTDRSTLYRSHLLTKKHKINVQNIQNIQNIQNNVNYNDIIYKSLINRIDTALEQNKIIINKNKN
jgi:hypothetical protein